MGWNPTLYAVVGVASATLSLGVGVLAARDRSNHGVAPFVALLVALAGWSLTYGFQTGFTTRAEQLLFQRLALAIGGTIPTLWFLFCVGYVGYGDWFTRPRTVLIAVDPAAFALLTLTNPIHGLVWHGASFAPATGPPVVDLSLHLAYYVHIAYAYALVVAGLVLIARSAMRTPTLYRKQSATLIFGAILPFLTNVGYTLRLDWGPMPTVDLTPFAFVVTGSLFGLALFQFDLLDRTPVARRQVLDDVGDGIVVLDGDGTVVDVNETARQVLDPPPTPGDTAQDVFGDDATSAEAALAAVEGTTLTTVVNGEHRAYDVRRSALTDHQQRTVGDVVGLRDVTERHAKEQRLDVTQRVLRHNLRNDVTVIVGQAEYLAGETDGERAAAADAIVDTATDLSDLAEKTRQLVALGSYDGATSTPRDVKPVLADAVAAFREAHDDVRVSRDLPETIHVTVPDEELLGVAVENLLENAIEHNDADGPWVSLSVNRTPDRVRVRVADNGPGIPPVERAVLEEGSETPLRHGSGVGLWLTYWAVTRMGGEISFASRDPRGSVVTVELPRASSTA